MFAFPGTQPASRKIPSIVCHKRPQHTNAFAGLFLRDVVHNGLDRLVRLGPFLDKELCVGADDMRAHKGGSQVRRRLAWVRAWPENVGVARVGAARSVGERASYRIHYF